MPASAKTTSVTLLVSTAEILRKIYVGKGKRYETHHEAVNDIIVNHCKLKEVIDEQYHHLSFRAVGKEVFIVKDNAKGLEAEIAVAYDAESKKKTGYTALWINPLTATILGLQ
jgi:hypothetical protein